MDNEKLEFTLDPEDVLKQLADNFTRPLELIREAVSNSYDAGANNIRIKIVRQPWEGDQRWVVTIRDDGAGMVLDEQPPTPYTGNLRKFFKLGDSMRRDITQHGPVGQKGLGIKVALHSEFLSIRTWAGHGFPMYKASCHRPWAHIFNGEFPKPEMQTVEEIPESIKHSYTEIEVVGYFDNDGSHFRADEVEDYIRWFTKWGSFENRIEKLLANDQEQRQLHLGTLREAPTGNITLEAPGANAPRQIPFGHPFPDSAPAPIKPNQKLETVLSEVDGMSYDKMVERLEEAKRRHWRYIVKVGSLDDIPDITWQAVISVEGDATKRAYNPFLRQRQRSNRFSYKAEDRYGLWLCKDYFCVQQANDVAMEILGKEGQRTRFKILLNCQNFGINADRTSVGNTDAGILRGIQEAARGLVKEMVEDDSWTWTELIEEETEVRTSIRQDKLQLKQRSVEASKKPQLHLGDQIIFRQPANEAETVLLLERLKHLFPAEFSFFEPLDWRTDKGIDCIVESHEPGEMCRFVEFKKDLANGRFNHTFSSLHYVVCWQVKASDGSVLEDPAKTKRKLKRQLPEDYNLPDTAPWTLEGGQQIIKVYSLKDILQEKLNVIIKNP